jgi:hypothetical protein
MKAELVNLVSKNGTETVVLLSTDLTHLTREEQVQVVEFTVWLIDEGWTVATTAGSPLANLVHRATEAMASSYRTVEDDSTVQMVPSGRRLPPLIG